MTRHRRGEAERQSVGLRHNEMVEMSAWRSVVPARAAAAADRRLSLSVGGGGNRSGRFTAGLD